MSAELMILDGLITMMNSGMRAAALMKTAREEGRTVTEEEYQELLEQSADLREAWDRAGE